MLHRGSSAISTKRLPGACRTALTFFLNGSNFAFGVGATYARLPETWEIQRECHVKDRSGGFRAPGRLRLARRRRHRASRQKGYRVKIVCLAFGEHGESQFAWKQPGMTLEKVRAGRRHEAERAAAALGAEIEFFDAGDYPLRLTDAHMERLIDIYRELNPSFVLTHSLEPNFV
jgi:hypothetical protein